MSVPRVPIKERRKGENVWLEAQGELGVHGEEEGIWR